MGAIRYLTNWLRHPRDSKASLSTIEEKLNCIPMSNVDESFVYRLYLQDKALHCKEKGVSKNQYINHKVIVSLTTFGERIHIVHLAIESIMQGSIKPNQIILWLSEKEFKEKKLPQVLQQQQERGLEIAYCNDLKSYNKLIPSLQRFPDDTIITIDDDVIYEYDIVERLVNAHIGQPQTICACRMHRIKLDNNAKPLSYLNWEQCVCDNIDSELNFPTGVGGVLYPPHCFNKEVFNETVFLDICPKADDIWFYIMARINNTHNKWVKTDSTTGYRYIVTTSPDSLSLYNTSPTLCGNDIQFQSILNKYNLKLTY